MSFGTPLALLFLLLGIPVILLYLLKQRRRRVQVSSLLFWDQVLRDEQTVASFTKLRRLRSLLLHLLILSLIAFALSRPIFGVDALSARRVVLLLDTSASMTVQEEEATRFDTALDLARDVIGGMSFGDTMMLVSVNETAEVIAPFTDSRNELLEHIDAIEVSHAASRFEHAWKLIENLPPDERPTEVYVVSDGAYEAAEVDVPEKTKFAYLSVGSESANAGITAFEVRPLPALPQEFELLAECTNETDDDITAPYTLTVGERLVDAGEVSIPAGGQERKSLRQLSTEGGAVVLTLEYEDAFPLDNAAYAVLPAVIPIPVTLVTEANLFLESALATDDGLALEMQFPSTYDAASDAAIVTIFDRCPPESMPQGNAIFIGTWPSNAGIATDGNLEEPIITEWDRDHPINRHLNLTNVSIESAFRAQADESWTPLIESFGDPLALYRETATGRALVVPFDTVSSNLPLRVAFPILLANAVREMAESNRNETWQSRTIGEVLTRDEIDTLSDIEEPIGVVLGPGESIPEESDAEDVAGLVNVFNAGVYRAALASGETAPLFAANLANRAESRIAPSDELPVITDEPVPLIENGLRLGSEPWILLASCAAALLLAEWFLFHRRWVE